MEPISLQHLQLLRDDLDKLTLHDRINNYQLKSDRADVIVHALDIYLYILKKLECHEIIVPKIGLSDGMIYNMFMKHSNLLWLTFFMIFYGVINQFKIW